MTMNFPAPTPEQARVIWLAVTALAGAVIVAILAGVIWGLGKVLHLLSPVLWPLAVAGVIAYLLDPVVDFIERRGASRARAIVCVFALAAMIVLALAGSVVPQVIRETRQLAEKIPGYAVNLQQDVQKWINKRPELLPKFLQLKLGTTPDTNSVSTTNAPTTVTNSAAAPEAGASAPSIWSGALDARSV